LARRAVHVLQVKTYSGWQRAGRRPFWRWKCQQARARIPGELVALIRTTAQENPGCGEAHMAGELLVKLCIRVSRRTLRT
jgi:hypothetical protein